MTTPVIPPRPATMPPRPSAPAISLPKPGNVAAPAAAPQPAFMQPAAAPAAPAAVATPAAAPAAPAAVATPAAAPAAPAAPVIEQAAAPAAVHPVNTDTTVTDAALAAATAAPVETPIESAAPAAATPAAAAPKKRRGRLAGTPNKRSASLITYPGCYALDENNEPILVAADGDKPAHWKLKKLSAVPTDFDAEKHTKLKPDDFDTESIFWKFKAAQLRKAADSADKKAETLAKLGSGQNQKDAAKFLKIMEQAFALRDLLISQGVDPAQLPLPTPPTPPAAPAA